MLSAHSGYCKPVAAPLIAQAARNYKSQHATAVGPQGSGPACGALDAGSCSAGRAGGGLSA